MANPISIDVSDEIASALKAEADKNFRSVSAQIRFILTGRYALVETATRDFEAEDKEERAQVLSALTKDIFMELSRSEDILAHPLVLRYVAEVKADPSVTTNFEVSTLAGGIAESVIGPIVYRN